MRTLRFDVENYLSLGMSYLAHKKDGDHEAAAIYDRQIEDYLARHRFGVPAKCLMLERAKQLNKMEVSI